MKFREILENILPSIKMDLGMFSSEVSRVIPLNKRIEFVLKKYWFAFLFLNGIKKYKQGSSHITIGNEKLYCTSIGLERYQTALVRQSNFIRHIKRKNFKTIVDVGANFGYFAIAMIHFFPSSTIYAIEPISDIFKILKKNTAGKAKVKIFQTAISNRNGKSFVHYDPSMPEASFIINKRRNISNSSSMERVSSVTLDEFTRKNRINQIDYLKIDVESFEKHVLDGAINTLSKTKYICLEIVAEDNPNYTFSELVGKLYSRKYNFQLVDFHIYAVGGKKTFVLGDFFFKNTFLTV